MRTRTNTMLKRQRDVLDSSPTSSTPPQRAKLTHSRSKPRDTHILESETSTVFSSPCHIPSDSPSNPFGRFKPSTPTSLPRSTPTTSHLALRFQLGQAGRNVFRTVRVPENYTFWHLARLSQFLFGWKDTRRSRNPYNPLRPVDRKIEHIFTVQKRVQFYAAGRNPGLFKAGECCLRVATTDSMKNLKRSVLEDEDGPVGWESEEAYRLEHLWKNPTSTRDLGRAVIYEHDVLSSRKEAIYISLVPPSDLDAVSKLRAHSPVKSLSRSQVYLPSPATDSNAHDLFASSATKSNAPFVIEGQGLPNDDDDDEDFPLDLQQWNEEDAFRRYLFGSKITEEDEDDEDEDPYAGEEALDPKRLAKEQDAVRKSLNKPLPKRLPVDEDERPEAEEEEIEERAVLGNDTLDAEANEDEDQENKSVVVFQKKSSSTVRSPLKKRLPNTGVPDSDVSQPEPQNKCKPKLIFPRLAVRPTLLANPKKVVVGPRTPKRGEEHRRERIKEAIFRALNKDEEDEEDEAEGEEEDDQELMVDQLDDEGEI